jgi:hypothetical protein
VVMVCGMIVPSFALMVADRLQGLKRVGELLPTPTRAGTMAA